MFALAPSFVKNAPPHSCLVVLLDGVVFVVDDCNDQTLALVLC